MADEPLSPAELVGATTAQLDEMDHLRLMLGQQTFDVIQQQVWNDDIATHEPPYTSGIWEALLVALRAAVRH